MAVLLAACTSALVHWIWTPPRELPTGADAIVVLAYGQDRLRQGRELAQDGVSDELVVSVSRRTAERVGNGQLMVAGPGAALPDGAWVEECGAQYPDYSVTCIYPQPNTTEGEAIAVQRLAQERGWDSVVIVTEPSHLHRSLRIFGRCVQADISGVASDLTGPWYRNVWRTVYEIGATAKLALTGACDG